MQTRHVRRIGALAAVVAVGATGVVSVGGAAGKAADGHKAEKKIKMELQGQNLFFKGPKKIEHGAKLDIINKTNPNQVGPHTFTLVNPKKLPKTRKQVTKCERLKTKFCMNIVQKHKANPQTGQIKKPSLDYGKKGWDKSFGKKGDSWVAQAKGESEARKVSAKPGTTLYYFCVVHPFMQGKIKVTK
jgi:hypothetical protein